MLKLTKKELFGAIYGEYGKKCNVYIVNEHFDNIIITEGLYTFSTHELKEATKKKYLAKLKKLNEKSDLSRAYIELLQDYIDDFIKELNEKVLLSSRKLV